LPVKPPNEQDESSLRITTMLTNISATELFRRVDESLGDRIQEAVQKILSA